MASSRTALAKALPAWREPLEGLLGRDITRLDIHTRGGIYANLIHPGTGPLPSYSISQSVLAVTFTESYREAAMRCEVSIDPTLVEAAAHPHVGANLVVYGYTEPTRSAFSDVFHGTVYTDDRDADNGQLARSYVAYDPLTLLARNEGSAVFTNETLTNVVQVLLGEGVGGEVPLGDIWPTTVPLGQIVQSPGMSHWAVLNEARSRHYNKTGEILFLRWNYGTRAVDLLPMGGTGVVWKLNDATNLLGGNFHESAEEMRTQVRVVAEEYEDDGSGNSVLRQVQTAMATADPGDALRLWFGMLKTTVPPNNSEQTAAEALDQANKQLAHLARTSKRLTTRSLLIPGIRRGDRVEIWSNALGVATAWNADTVRTEYREGVMEQTMDLILESADLEGFDPSS